jgi:aryl-alcohol dehydrogenase-like predicted oxidoreductase
VRYRPLGNTGMSVSAMSLVLDGSRPGMREADWIALIYAALESGINGFEIVGAQPALIDGVGQALQAIDRRLVFLAWRLGWMIGASGQPERDFSPETLARVVETIVARTGLTYLDATILDDPAANELSPRALDMLRRLKDMGRIRLLGVTGRDDAMDSYISSGAFDLIATPFSLISGWKERLRVKAAVDRDMVVLGYDYYPQAIREPKAQDQAKSGLWGRTAAKPLAGVGTYAFLDRTSHWSGEEICLAYAMTEPSLCTVQVPADRIDRVELMAAVCERELPSGVPAQIEMARFAPPPGKEPEQQPPAQTARRA